MKAVTRVVLVDDDREKFFGEGPYRLLCEVEETGSLAGAAKSMGMAYSKALKIISRAEQVIGSPLMERKIGGVSGGGSQLTDTGRAWVNRYAAYRDACRDADARLYQKFFPEEGVSDSVSGEIGCVIMASGLGKRFGGNKLMADFHGEPMIMRTLAATRGIARRVVVTRHEDVAELCRKQGIPVILHTLQGRNDTVRLGIDALGDTAGCMFCPGDQPLLTAETVNALVRSAQSEPEKIWRTEAEGVPGAPVIFPRWAYPELRSLPEGKGGGYLIKKSPEQVNRLPVRDRYELMDVDTVENLKELLER